MITAIIILLGSTIILCMLLNKRTSKGDCDQVESFNPTIMASINGGEYKELKSSPEERAIRDKRQECFEMRDKRRKRHHKIWLVLRYMITYKQLTHSSNFYDFNRNMSDHKYAIGELKKFHIDDYSFDAAVRFCRMEYYYGTCDYQLTDEDIKFAKNWLSNSIDAHEILKNVLLSYQEYWDNVLASYVRPSARYKRLQYLIDNLKDIMELSDIQEYPDILQGVSELQSRYQSQLNKKAT